MSRPLAVAVVTLLVGTLIALSAYGIAISLYYSSSEINQLLNN